MFKEKLEAVIRGKLCDHSVIAYTVNKIRLFAPSNIPYILFIFISYLDLRSWINVVDWKNPRVVLLKYLSNISGYENL